MCKINLQRQAYEYILTESFQNAEKVKQDILKSTHKLMFSPEIYPPDKYRKNNDDSFRAYELRHYRISYQITEKQILLLEYDIPKWSRGCIKNDTVNQLLFPFLIS